MAVLRIPRLAVLTLLVLVSGCSGHTSSAAKKSASPLATAPDMTVAEVFAHADRSLRAVGVYHVTIRTVQHAGDGSYSSTDEVWIDASRGAVREQVTSTSPSFGTLRDTALRLPDAYWDNGDRRPALTCQDTSAAVAALLWCLDPNRDQATVTLAPYEGRASIVLTAHLEGGGEDTITKTISRFYLDPESALPLGRTENGTYDDGTVVPLDAATTYAAQTLTEAQLAPGFFDPASLGWSANASESVASQLSSAPATR